MKPQRWNVNIFKESQQDSAVQNVCRLPCTVYGCVTLSNSQLKPNLCSVLLANIVAELWLVLTDLWELNSFSKLTLFPNCPTRNLLSFLTASSPPALQALGPMAANALLKHRSTWMFPLTQKVFPHPSITLCCRLTELSTWVCGCVYRLITKYLVNLQASTASSIGNSALLFLPSSGSQSKTTHQATSFTQCLTITSFSCQILKQYFSLVGQHWH